MYGRNTFLQISKTLQFAYSVGILLNKQKDITFNIQQTSKKINRNYVVIIIPCPYPGFGPGVKKERERGIENERRKMDYTEYSCAFSPSIQGKSSRRITRPAF